MPVLTRSMKEKIKQENTSKKEVKTKKEKKISNPPNNPPEDDDDVDENGNLKGFIDYSFDKGKKKSKKKSFKNKTNIQDMFMNYMLMNSMNSMNNMNRMIMINPYNSVGMGKTFHINKSIDEIITDKEDNEDKEEDETMLNEIKSVLNLDSGSETISESSENVVDDEEDDEDDDEEELTEFEEEFLEMMDYEYNEDEEFDYFHELNESEQKSTIKTLKEISSVNKTEIPLKFKILNLKMNLPTKSIAIQNIDKMSEMDPSSGEYGKMDKWINGLIKIPFGEYSNLKINSENSITEKREFIQNTKKTLDKAIYGHKEAKTHILQVIGQWITNPNSHGNVLALQGPMGNGKTTLVKEGIAKAIGRPFAFIALGGSSDSSFFDGHSYTYEGSHWGRIIDILMQSKCMNPIIYFDELDKISETYKGQEVVHFLTHLTDQSQNSLFQDNYFPGINIDLSKCLFIFSFNDESKVDRILKDRMYVINTKGFNTKEKVEITKNYLLPELMEIFMFNDNEIKFNETNIEYIINNYTGKEEGVRNLKRSIETIISKINIYNLSYDEDKKEAIDLTYQIKDFKLPLEMNNDIIDSLLKTKKSDGPPTFMYM